MLLKLFLLFVVLPLLELTLLLLLADVTDWWVALLLVIGTGFLGAWLAQRQGWRTWERIRDELRQGRMPANALFDGVLILLAGVLLLTPGLISDLVGILLLFPLTRGLFKLWLAEWFRRRYLPVGLNPSPYSQNDGASIEQARIVDSYVIERTDEPISPKEKKHRHDTG